MALFLTVIHMTRKALLDPSFFEKGGQDESSDTSTNDQDLGVGGFGDVLGRWRGGRGGRGGHCVIMMSFTEMRFEGGGGRLI